MLDFPNAPIVGQQYPAPPVDGVPTYTWDGEKWTTGPVDVANVVKTTPQSLSFAQQLQARQNIYAAPGDAMAYSGIQINGSCEVNQRIGSVNTALALVNGSPPKYAVDGIRAAFKHAAATAAFTVNQGGSAPVGIPNSATLVGGAALSAPAAGDYAFISVPVEGYRCARLGWNTGVQMPLTAVFLFYASAAGTFAVSVRSGISDRSYVTEVAYPNANTWQFCKVTIPPPPGGTWQIGAALGLDFAVAMCVGSTFQAANNSWSNGNFFGTPGMTNFFASGGVFAAISGVTLLPGNDGPMNMSQLGNIQRPFAEELARCQRYYEKSFDYNVLPAAGTGVNSTCIFPQAGGAATAPIQPQVFFKTTKRVTPTVTLFNPQNPGAMARNVTRGSDFPATALNAVSPDAFQVFATTPGSSQAWDTCALHWTADAGF